MRIFGLAGWSGSGKTTLITSLIPELVSRGITVSTIKHAHHSFDIDQPGKESQHHRQAGAQEVMIASGQRWALMHELRGAAEPSLDELLERMTPGRSGARRGFQASSRTPRRSRSIRHAVGKPLLHPDDPFVVAIASNQRLPNLRPWLPLSDGTAIANFILGHEAGLAPWRS